eukprot:CFRG0882T1
MPNAFRSKGLRALSAATATALARRNLPTNPILTTPALRNFNFFTPTSTTQSTETANPTPTHTRTSMSQPLQGFENPKYAVVDLSKPPQTRISKLPSGLTVASEDSPGAFCVVGVAIEAGTRYEEKDASGVFHFLDRMSYKSTLNRGQGELVSALEKLGGSAFCQGSRDCIVYYMCIFNKDVETALELLAESVLRPAFLQEEVDEQRALTEYEKADMLQRPEVAITEIMYETAFSESPVGQPLICPNETIEKMTPELLRKYHDQYYIAPRMVVTGAGIDHDRLLALTEKYFGSVPTEPPTPLPVFPKSVYKGGKVFRHNSLLKHVHVILGFEGLPWDHEDIYALCTLQMLMGGGSSFSAGGPGKGMHSRLMTQVLNRHFWVESCMAQLVSHGDTGLFYLHGTCNGPDTRPLLEVMIHQYNEVSNISDIEVARAQNQLKSHLLMNLESRVVQFDDISKQILTSGKRIQPLELCKLVDSVTKEDIIRVVERLRTGNPTVVLYGDMTAVTVPE